MNLVKSYWNNLPLLSRALQLSNSVDRYINNFKVVDNLSDRGSLILHLFKVKTVTPLLRPLPGSTSPSFFSTPPPTTHQVSHRQPEILVFRLQQNFKVGLLQPSAVKVYEYYSPGGRLPLNRVNSF